MPIKGRTTMNEANPYAAPRSWGQDNVSSNCTREGKYVVIPVGSDLPPRCVKCNAPAVTPVKKRTVYWHHPGWYLLILINILVYAVVALIARKKAKVSPGLCQQHAAIRKRNITLWLVAALVVVVAVPYLSAHGLEQAIPILMLLALIALIMAALSSQLVTASKITNTTIKLKGCKEPFLESLDHEH
jgi:hypothetical protein